MTIVVNRNAVSSCVCIGCHIALGSAEERVQGVRGRREGPLHFNCATAAEKRVDVAMALRYLQAVNGNGVSAR